MSIPMQLNRRVTIQMRGDTKNALNESVGGWVNFITDGDGKLWASIRDLTGRQYVAAGGTQNAVTTRIMIRYRAGILPAMRVLHDANVYEITAVLGQDNKFLELMCVRGASNG